MTSPQLEDGYTRIANELLDAIIRAPLSKREMKVVFAVIRKTYGFGKKEDDLGLAQLAKMTGLHKPDVSNTVSDLVSKRVLNRQPGKRRHVIGVNKTWTEWDGVSKTLTVSESLTVSKILTERLVNHSPPPLVIHQPSKENQQKKLSKEKADARFDRWFSAYPNKKARGAAEKAFAKLSPDDLAVEAMIQAVQQQQAAWQRATAAGKWAPSWKHPATWINDQCWKDEIAAHDEPLSEVREMMRGAA